MLCVLFVTKHICHKTQGCFTKKRKKLYINICKNSDENGCILHVFTAAVGFKYIALKDRVNLGHKNFKSLPL